MTTAGANDDFAESFSAVLGSAPRVLVLGSMPGRRSLAEAEYYAHPRNAFWPIMQALAGIDASLTYEQRIAGLKASGIALWDVLRRCERPGSLDARIRSETVVANDFAGLFRRYPSIGAVFFNGTTAFDTYRRNVQSGLPEADAERPLIRLPSTSPAYASMSLQQKTTRWVDEIAPYLG